MTAAVIFSILSYVHWINARDITISPADPTIDCLSEDECYPLSKLYANNPDRLQISSNTTIKFLRDLHFLESNIVIRDVDDMTLVFQMGSQLHCDNRSGLMFVNITNLHIYGLTMTNCGAEISKDLINETLSVQTETTVTIEIGTKAAILAINIKGFHIDHAVIRENLMCVTILAI